MENDDYPDGDTCEPENEITTHDFSPSRDAVYALTNGLRNKPNCAGML
jgi:hypothetical protein